MYYFFYFTLAITFIVETHSLMVLITNLEDLKKIGANVKHKRAIREDSFEVSTETFETSDRRVSIEDDTKEKPDSRKSRTQLDDSQVEEIVVKVKERLIKDLHLKFPEDIIKLNKKLASKTIEIDLGGGDQEGESEPDKKNTRENRKNVKSPSTIKSNHKVRITTSSTSENPIFEELALNYKNDSYEDYVLPKKDKKYFEEIPVQDEPKNNALRQSITVHEEIITDRPTKIKNPQEIHEPPEHINKTKYAPETNDKDIFDYEETIPGEDTTLTTSDGKVRTESLLEEENIETQTYNHNIPDKNNNKTTENVHNTAPINGEITMADNKGIHAFTDHHEDKIEKQNDDHDVHNRPKDSTIHEKVENTTSVETTSHMEGINTMIPRKERYTLSSPNYYAKLPKIAEKYDPKEPIPQQDQIPEAHKQIGPKPELINGKIKV